ncbi:MAG: TerB family tellurite resistance protein [Bacteroidales bacterium]|nr:TerB family tellurite resistance protein [Bacteroidales bacterium]
MAKFAKWIGGALGWSFMGPLGGLLGFAIGSVIDGVSVETYRMQGRTTPGDFIMSLLVLVAAVMKADGKVLKSELDYVKNFFVRQFGTSTASEAISMLGDLIKQEIPVDQVCGQIRVSLDNASKLQLLHFLYGIAQADGHVHPLEVQLIDDIAYKLGIGESERNSIKSMFVPDTDSAYKVLGISRNATNEEIKKAYRNMANKNHPDKVAYLGDEFKKAANEKFQRINEAYEAIKKERGLK